MDLYTYQGSAYSSSNNSNNSLGFFFGSTSTTTTNEVSAKGLKADGKLTINDGTIVTDCSDDALHCAKTATVKGGTLTLATGDDGIHSDSELIIDGGKMNITKSYEGIEAPTITVNDGTVHVVSSDDGFNASDGSGETAMGNGGFGYGGPNSGQMWGGNTIAVTDENGKVLSVLRFNKSAQLLTYCTKDTTAANCKVYLNPEYNGTFDEFGKHTISNIYYNSFPKHAGYF